MPSRGPQLPPFTVSATPPRLSGADNDATAEAGIDTLKRLLLAEEQSSIRLLAGKLGTMELRAGSDEALQASVARIIDGALREAEVARHRELASALAPVVVSTIRREIVNSRDQMVEALYPITGQLVSAYVAHAVKDMMAELNERIESGVSVRRWSLRLKSLVTGRPYSELLLKALNIPRVEELFLIRRGSGELLGHWRANEVKVRRPGKGSGTADGREALVSSYLTALTEFAREAFAGEQSQLQTLDIQSHRIYLRGSPAHLLAAKCAGAMPAGVEQEIDEMFIDILQAQTKLTDAAAVGGHSPEPIAFEPVAERINLRLKSLHKSEGSSPSLAIALVSLIGLAVLGGVGWLTYTDWQNRSARSLAQTRIAEDARFAGLPIQVEASGVGRKVVLTGLAPSRAASEELLARIGEGLPGATVTGTFKVVPNIDSVAELEGRMMMLREQVGELEEGRQRLDSLGKRLSDLAASLDAYAKRDQLATFARSEDVTGLKAAADDLAARHRALQSELVQQIAGTASRRDVAELTASGKAMAAELQRLAAAVAALQPVPPDARARLTAWVADHAIFFGDDTDYRDPAAAERILGELATLLGETDVALRIVGYTDVKGDAGTNRTLGLSRAERVAADLVAAGISSTRLIKVGRASERPLSAIEGSTSPNRRVVFELDLTGEP